MTTAPDMKSMQIHHDARHPKMPFKEDKLVNFHAAIVSAVDPNKPRPGLTPLECDFFSPLKRRKIIFFWV
ncbi:hypothetical protein Tsubulata_019919 [Turnera subulata]|uniref:Uncharacterized protein n=1 Tax=Turnera subulata TaxID=218843 RepID=A0A9Q0JPD2_9ROSI|nr:hypothetical protein Tsubulata_019919 [Turnera subulata]